MAFTREAVESPLYQGTAEQIIYTLVTTNFAASPSISGSGFVVHDETANWSDVTATVCPGTATASGNTVTFPALKSLTDGHRYRVDLTFTSGGATYTPFFIVIGEK